MQYGLHLPNTALHGDPQLFAEIASEGEDAGWDGVFLWDQLFDATHKHPDIVTSCDPWIAIAAMALATQRIRLGPLISPLSRRRPWNVARQTVTLDHLSRGRLILPVGLGWVPDGGFSLVGEETDRRVRGERLDESLELITGLWTGEPFAFSGKHFRTGEMTFLPPPVQRPRIPIWVSVSANALREGHELSRALRWDGVHPFGAVSVADVGALGDKIAAQRSDDFDIIVESEEAESSVVTVREYASAGATWWLESVYKYVWPVPGSIEALRARIRRGPPRPD